MEIKKKTIHGRMITWITKKRERVSHPTDVPPRINVFIHAPTNGIAPAISVPTVVAQYANWFHGRRYPVNPNTKVKTNRKTPMSQVISRGLLKEPVKNVRNI